MTRIVSKQGGIDLRKLLKQQESIDQLRQGGVFPPRVFEADLNRDEILDPGEGQKLADTLAGRQASELPTGETRADPHATLNLLMANRSLAPDFGPAPTRAPDRAKLEQVWRMANSESYDQAQPGAYLAMAMVATSNDQRRELAHKSDFSGDEKGALLVAQALIAEGASARSEVFEKAAGYMGAEAQGEAYIAMAAAADSSSQKQRLLGKSEFSREAAGGLLIAQAMVAKSLGEESSVLRQATGLNLGEEKSGAYIARALLTTGTHDRDRLFQAASSEFDRDALSGAYVAMAICASSPSQREKILSERESSEGARAGLWIAKALVAGTEAERQKIFQEASRETYAEARSGAHVAMAIIASGLSGEDALARFGPAIYACAAG